MVKRICGIARKLTILDSFQNQSSSNNLTVKYAFGFSR